MGSRQGHEQDNALRETRTTIKWTDDSARQDCERRISKEQSMDQHEIKEEVKHPSNRAEVGEHRVACAAPDPARASSVQAQCSVRTRAEDSRTSTKAFSARIVPQGQDAPSSCLGVRARTRCTLSVQCSQDTADTKDSSTQAPPLSTGRHLSLTTPTLNCGRKPSPAVVPILVPRAADANGEDEDDNETDDCCHGKSDRRRNARGTKAEERERPQDAVVSYQQDAYKGSGSVAWNDATRKRHKTTKVRGARSYWDGRTWWPHAKR
eukprot:3639866-Pleurochrysis_carterae.AAC.2